MHEAIWKHRNFSTTSDELVIVSSDARKCSESQKGYAKRLHDMLYEIGEEVVKSEPLSYNSITRSSILQNAHET